MELVVVFVIIFTSMIQSLFGTPLLLFLGYSFMESSLILLPISASINFIQIIKNYSSINISIYKNVVVYGMSFVEFEISFFIGIFLIIIVLKEKSVYIKNIIDKLFNYNKTFYIIMGSIHGITNLGGALLTEKVFNKI